MLELHIAEIIFIKTLLEDELMNIEMKRHKTNQVCAFDLVYKERVDYIRELIKKFDDYLGGKYE